jgi:hypothetical protein
MHCYLCAAANEDRVAIAACPHCGAGLCLEHFEHPVLGHGGMQYSCDHVAQAAAIRSGERPWEHEEHAFHLLPHRKHGETSS